MEAGQEVLIYGAGPVGLSFVKFGRLWNLGYIGVVDPQAEKRARALAMGADAVFAPDSMELQNLHRLHGRPLDAVIDAVGHESIINDALPRIKLGGAICVYGVIGEPDIRIKKSQGPYNFNLYMHQWPTRARERAAQDPLTDWLREGKLSPAEFVSCTFPLEHIEDALAVVKRGQAIKVLLKY